MAMMSIDTTSSRRYGGSSITVYKCKSCPEKTFYSEKEAREHVLSEHASDMINQCKCKICGKTFDMSDAKGIAHHLLTDHPELFKGLKRPLPASVSLSLSKNDAFNRNSKTSEPNISSEDGYKTSKDLRNTAESQSIHPPASKSRHLLVYSIIFGLIAAIIWYFYGAEESYVGFLVVFFTAISIGCALTELALTIFGTMSNKLD